MKDNARSQSKRGSKNPQWKGDKVQYSALHEWVSHRKDMTHCEICGQNHGKMDLHNIDGQYSRDLNTWISVCRSCHMWVDGRMLNLKRGTKQIIWMVSVEIF